MSNAWQNDYSSINEDLLTAARGLTANTMARIVEFYTPGSNWHGCSKRYIADQLAKNIRRSGRHESDVWRETTYQGLLDAMSGEKRPPTKKQRAMQKIRERALYEIERDDEVDEWLRGGFVVDDIDAQVRYTQDQLAAAHTQVEVARMESRRLLRIRTTLDRRKKKSA